MTLKQHVETVLMYTLSKILSEIHNIKYKLKYVYIKALSDFSNFRLRFNTITIFISKYL